MVKRNSHYFHLKPYLKRAGSKRQQMLEIKKHLPKNIHTYYELFVGAGAVFFDLQPEKAVINDSNTELIMTSRVIKEQSEDLITLLQDHQQKNTESYYYQIRSLDRDRQTFARLTDLEKAARLIFLNKICYNGLYRVNTQGLFNVLF